MFLDLRIKAFRLKGGNQILTSNYTVNIIFDTGSNFIFLPFEYLKDLEPNLEKIGCSILEYVDDSKYGNNFDKAGFKDAFRLVCSSYSLPQVQFVLGNTTFYIPEELTFYYEKGFYYSYILFVISNKLNSSPYIFGSSFFMTFHTLFNHDDKKMEFYPLESKYIVTNSENIFGKVIVIIGIISLFMILCFIIFYYINLRRKYSKVQYLSIFKHDTNIEMVGKTE